MWMCTFFNEHHLNELIQNAHACIDWFNHCMYFDIKMFEVLTRIRRGICYRRSLCSLRIQVS